MTSSLENIKIIGFRVRNCTVFEDSKEIKLDKITVITGKNNIGKSSILSAIYLLLNGYGHKLNAPYLVRLPHIKDDIPIDLKFQLSHSDSLIKETIEQIDRQMTRAPEPDVPIYREWLDAIDKKEILISLDIWCPLKSNSSIKKISVVGSKVSWEPLITKLPPIFDSILSKTIIKLLQNKMTDLRGKMFYFTSHRVATLNEWEGLSFDSDKLSSDARNLKSFLNRLFSSGSEKVALIKNHMKAAFPEINDIIIPTESLATLKLSGNSSPVTDIRFKFKYYNPENTTETISLTHCGTGVEQYLSIITAIITAQEPHLFLIDEPHSFLHPFAEKKLLELISEYHQHQYIITTHSPTILNSVPADSIRLLKRNEDNGSVFCSNYDINDAISELGLTPSDLWFYKKILFVEGPTEEKILPIILRKIFSDLNLNKIKIADLNNQASAIRGSRKKKMMHEMLKIAIDAMNPFGDEFSIDYVVLLDKEKQNDAEIKKLNSDCNGKLIFTDQLEIENYLLVPESIYSILIEECEQYGVDIPTKEKFEKKLEELKKCHDKGSVVLQELFRTYKLTYEKTKHGPLIAIEIDSDSFKSFRIILEKFIR